MVRLAQNYGKKPVSLAVVAKKEKISLGYLERLAKKLKQAGLVDSERGMKGGYFLVKHPRQITVKDVVIALEGGLGGFYCVQKGQKALRKCPTTCLTKKVWVRLYRAIDRTLGGMRLSELCGENKKARK